MEGTRPQERPHQRWIENVRETMMEREVDWHKSKIIIKWNNQVSAAKSLNMLVKLEKKIHSMLNSTAVDF